MSASAPVADIPRLLGPACSWLCHRERDAGRVPIHYVDDMLGAERELSSNPERIVLVDAVRLVIENAKITARYSLPDDDPHAFNRDRFFRVVYADPKNQFCKITGLEPLPNMSFWYPEGGRRMGVPGFSVV